MRRRMEVGLLGLLGGRFIRRCCRGVLFGYDEVVPHSLVCFSGYIVRTSLESKLSSFNLSLELRSVLVR